MAEQTPNSRDTHINPTAEQVPHSGVHGYEQPVFNFNGRSLQEALESGDLHIEYDEAGNPKVIVPDTLAEHQDPTQTPMTESHVPFLDTTTEKKAGHRRIAAIAAGAVGAALIGGYGALKMFGSEEEPRVAPTNQPTASAGVNPGESSPTSDPETTPPSANSEVVASVEQYPTAAEAIIPLNAKITEYMNYHGAIEKLTSSSLTPEEMAEHDAMLVSVFGEDLTDPGIATVVANLQAGWLEAIGYMSLTQQSIEAGYDSELFQLGATVSDISTLNGNQIQFTLDNFANFEENGIDENMAPEYAEAIEADLRVTATLEQVDGAWRITGWLTERI